MVVRILITCHLLLLGTVGAMGPIVVVPTSQAKLENDDLKLSKDARKNYNDMFSIAKSTPNLKSAKHFLEDMKKFSKQVDPAQLKEALGSLSTQLNNQVGGPASLLKSFVNNATSSINDNSQFQRLVEEYRSALKSQPSLKKPRTQKAKPTKTSTESAVKQLPAKSRKSYKKISKAIKSKTLSFDNAKTIINNTPEFSKYVSPAQFKQTLDSLSSQLSGPSGSLVSLVESFFQNVTSGENDAAQIQQRANEYQTALKKFQPAGSFSKKTKPIISPETRAMFDGIFKATPSRLAQEFSDTWTTFTNMTSNSANSIDNLFDDFSNNASASEKADGISKTVSQGIGDLSGVVENLFPNATNSTKKAVKTLTDVASGVSDTIKGVSDVLANKNSTVGDKVGSVASTLANSLSSLFGHWGKKSTKKSTKKAVIDTSTSKPGKNVIGTSTSKPAKKSSLDDFKNLFGF